MSMTNHYRNITLIGKFKQELVVIFILAAAIFIVLMISGINLFEILHKWTRKYENWELDELLVTVIFLFFAMSFFSLRRLREIKRQNNLLEKAHESLLISAQELEFRVKERTASLQESEERFRAIFESAQDGIFIKTCDLKYSHVNPAMGKILDKPATEVVGLTDEQLFGKQTSLHMAEVDKRVLCGEITEDVYERLVNDQVKSFHFIKVPIKNGKGDIVAICGIGRDITKRKHLEQALQRSERRFRELVELLPQNVFELDKNGTFTFMNRHGREDFGLPANASPEDFTVIDAVVPEEVDRAMKHFKMVLEGESVTDLEFTALRVDGSTFPVVANGAPIMQDDAVIGARVVAHNVSELKASEQAALLSRASFNSIVERSTDGIMVVDPEGMVLYANPSAASLFRRSEKNLGEIWMEGPLIYNETVEVGITRPNGEPGIAEMRVEPTDWEGSPAFLAMLRDITERRNAEEIRRRLATAVEQSADSIIIADAEGHIRYVNPAFERNSGYSVLDVIAKDTTFWLAKQYNGSSYDQILDTILNGKMWTGQLTGMKKDGTVCQEDVSISPVRDDSGVIVNYVVLKRDITNQLKMEQQLRSAQKMEAVGTLAGGIAHDFNNLLQIILGYGDLLCESIDKTDPSYDDLTMLIKAAERGADLVSSLLAFSRKTETEPRPLNINQELKLAHKMLLRTIPKMIEIELHLSEDIKMVNADPTQIEQIVLNLAVNARDAMPNGGRLVIETQNIQHDEEYCMTHLEVKPGKYVRISVTDTGCGMNREIAERVFEPFYTTKELGKGTGLGLAMVFGIVRSHGGHVSCYSEPEVGTTFHVDLPAVEGEIDTHIVKGQEYIPFGSETILVVDDEQDIRELAERYLTRAGYTTLMAENGKEALDIYCSKQSEISLVILDLIMPKMGGRECLRELLKLDPSLKILVASGFSPDGPTKDTINDGAKGFVDKPFKAKKMLKIIREVLDTN